MIKNKVLKNLKFSLKIVMAIVMVFSTIHLIHAEEDVTVDPNIVEVSTAEEFDAFFKNDAYEGKTLKLVRDETLEENQIATIILNTGAGRWINKSFTLDLNGCTIQIGEEFGNDPLFLIRNNAEVTIIDSKGVSGKQNEVGYKVTEVEGTSKPKTVTEKYVGGVITGHSRTLIKVENGTLNLNGGCLYNNGREADGIDGGAIFANSSAKVNINDAYLIDNKGSWGGAIRIDGNSESKLTMNNGVISGNVAWRRGGGILAGGQSKVEINGGYITNNDANSGENNSGDTGDGGAGIYLAWENELVMNGGYLTGNVSEIGGGAGIRAGFYDYNTERSTIYINGGYISGNKSKCEGAGISIGASCKAIIKGNTYITYNEVYETEHWGGGGIFCADGGYLQIMNLLVSDNTADGFGGGIAGCSTGRVFDLTNNGAAIFDNSAKGKNLSGESSSKQADHAYTEGNDIFHSLGYDDYFCALNSVLDNNMLGGGHQQWKGSSDNIAVDLGTTDEVLESMFLMGLTANPSEADKNSARDKATVIVTGNYSYTHGGGILCNGYAIFGEMPEALEIGDRLHVVATKSVQDAAHLNDTFKFDLLDNDKNVISTMTSVGTSVSNKGEINIVIPFKVQTNESNKEEVQVYYLVEKDLNEDSMFNTDKTVYRITVTGIKTIETYGQDKPVAVFGKQVEKSQIIKVEVTKGKFEESDFVEEVGSMINRADLAEGEEVAEYVMTYVTDLDNGANHAQSLVIEGDTFVNTLKRGDLVINKTINGPLDWNEVKDTISFEIKDADGEAILTISGNELTEENGVYVKTINGLPIGNYTVTEHVEDKIGYTITTTYKVDENNTNKVEVKHNQTSTMNVVNKYELITIDISGEKTWDDADNQDGIRPESITVNLLADGELERVTTVQANTNNKWLYEFNNLAKYKDGKEIVYTVEEVPVERYESNVDGYNITNTHTPETTNVIGTKTWEDNNNQDGIRPESITVYLLADGVEVKSVEVKADVNGNWTYEFNDLPKYKNGEEIEYTVEEVSVDGYETEITGYNITNTHTPETTNVKGEKIWEDNNDQDGIRPESITVNLLADGEVVDTTEVKANNEGNWTYEFNDLPKYNNGEEIEYTVEELLVEEYESEVDGFNIINTHTPAITQVTGTKTWDDNNNQDGIRPESITVKLLADGVEVKSVEVKADVNGNWTYEFNDLPKYKNGEEIEYTVEEVSVEGYESNVDGYNIKNVHIPNTIEITVTKIWDDNNDQDGIRPESITVKLLADGEVVDTVEVKADIEEDWTYTFGNLPEKRDGEAIVYTVEEVSAEGYESNVDGYIITNTHTPETTQVTGTKTWDDNNNQDGIRPESITVNLLADGTKVKSVEVKADVNGDWAYEFNDLPKYKDGEEIEYTVEEVSVEGYESEVDGYNITNIHTPATTEVKGIKTWDDNNNQDGIRPESITVRLYADNVEVDSMVVTDENGWQYSFKNMPVYRDNGVLIIYKVVEDDVEGYTAITSGYNITNTHTPKTTEVKGSKTWDDNNNQDGIRPDSITVNLIADGKVVDTTEVKADVNGNWTYEFKDLPKYKDGKEIVYTVEEASVDGYETEITGYNIINTHTPETTNVKGEKIWEDNNNQDGIRPDSITVNLLADGTKVNSVEVKADVNGDWTYEFNNLPKYNNGKEIEYTVEEASVAGYETEITGYNITNTHTPETTEVKGTKTWDDNNNQDGIRPDSIIVNLLADGTKVKSVEVKADIEGNWTYEFNDLPKYNNGEEIVYTVEEVQVNGYESKVDGFNIINTHTPAMTQVKGTKTWDDNNNQDGIRPESITVNLLADGEVVDTTEVTADTDGNWTYEFNDLPKYKDGEEIEYSVEEVPVEGYESHVDGYNIKNVHTPKPLISIDLVIYKADQDRKLLEGATFKLVEVVDGEEKDVQTISGGPEYEFEELTDGIYRIYETEAPEGYEGLDTYFEIEVIDGEIYFEGELTHTFTVINTNDGTEPDVLGDEDEFDDDEEFEDDVEGEEVVDTSDNQMVIEYIALAIFALFGICLLKKKEVGQN